VGVGRDGSVYVADTGNHRIQVFETSGAFITKFGAFGTGDGQFEFPDSIAVDAGTGHVFVADTFNNRIQEFDENGSFITSFGTKGSGDGQFNHPQGVAYNLTFNRNNGHPVYILYVADTDNNRIQVLSLEP
jgi:DNA-binding beta-propeller fold protein YncE